MEQVYVGGVCDNLIEESDVRSDHHFVEDWLIWRQISFRQSGDRRSKLIPLSRVTKKHHAEQPYVCREMKS